MSDEPNTQPMDLEEWMSCPECHENFRLRDAFDIVRFKVAEDAGCFGGTLRFGCPACGYGGPGWNRPTWDPKGRAYDPRAQAPEGARGLAF